MSSTPVLGFIKDITGNKVKAVEARLKKEKPNQQYIDPSQQNLVYSLLHKAVAVGNPEIVSAFLKAGADVNSKDSRGKTPLHWLAGLTTDQHYKTAEILLRQKGVDVQSTNDSKATPLHEAAAAGNIKLLRLLLSKGARADDTSPGHSPLHAACQYGHAWQSCMSVVELLLQAAPQQLAQQDASGFTPLMRLLQSGSWADAKQLLGKGDCAVSAQGSNGETAMLLACSCPSPDLELIAALIKAGASLSVQDKATGNTPLLLAIKLGGKMGFALAEVLLGAAETAADGCNLNAVNAAGESALSLAATAALTMASSSTGQAPTGMEDGNTAAVLDMLNMLLERKPEIPEQLAAALLVNGLAGSLTDSITAQLLKILPLEAVSKASAASTSLKSLTFESLLGCKLYRTAVTYLIKTTGQDPAAPQDAAGNTLLHLAVCGADDLPEQVAALLAVGVPGNAVNKERDTALHIAARAGHIGACRVLVEGGANVTWRNAKNRTPGNQLKLPDSTKVYLHEAEEAAKVMKEELKHQLWDEKMAATQTQSAYGTRVA